MSEETKIVTELKKLPCDKEGKIKRQFTANGIEYTIRDISDILSPRRYIEFNRFTTIFGFGYDFASILEHLSECKRNIIDINVSDSLTRMKPLLKIEAIEKAIVEASQMRYDASMYLASIFITSKDEDIRKWEIDEQTAKVDNWTEEGFDNASFLSLCVIFVPEYLKNYNEISATIANNNISL